MFPHPLKTLKKISWLFLLPLCLVLTLPKIAQSDMDFGNMQMPTPGNWMPPSPSNWTNNNQQRGTPPPEWFQNNNTSNSRQNNQPPPQRSYQGGKSQAQQSNRMNRRNRQQGSLIQHLNKLKTLLHLTPEQEPPWAAYKNSLMPQKKEPNSKASQKGMKEPGERDYIKQMERQIQRMERVLNRKKATLNSHKILLSILDKKQKVIFNLLSNQYRSQWQSRRQGPRQRP
jgi:hypothetical protein